MRSLVVAAFVLVAGCEVSLEGAPCPCADGYACQEGVCQRALDAPDAALDGGGPDGGGAPDATPHDGGPPEEDGGAAVPDAST